MITSNIVTLPSSLSRTLRLEGWKKLCRYCVYSPGRMHGEIFALVCIQQINTFYLTQFPSCAVLGLCCVNISFHVVLYQEKIEFLLNTKPLYEGKTTSGKNLKHIYNHLGLWWWLLCFYVVFWLDNSGQTSKFGCQNHLEVWKLMNVVGFFVFLHKWECAFAYLCELRSECVLLSWTVCPEYVTVISKLVAWSHYKAHYSWTHTRFISHMTDTGPLPASWNYTGHDHEVFTSSQIVSSLSQTLFIAA